MLDTITPLILTLDEECNIERVVERLTWAREVVVVDSGSRDSTRELLARFENVRCVVNPFRSHAEQWNFGLTETGIATEWVLALDADYVLTAELIEELRRLSPDPRAAGFLVRFRYCIFGKLLRAALYPPVIALFRRSEAHYVQDGHTQRVRVAGDVGVLASPIVHDDRKPLSRWMSSQCRYARLEVDLLATKTWRELRWPDRLRKLVVVMPPLVFLHCMFVGRGILDGWPGLFYALQRAIAEAVLSLSLVERKIHGLMADVRSGPTRD
jgi:glycosyltransferase involved in cell wall biosynthesis